MYQTIDDPEDEEFAPRAGFSILPFLIGAVLAALVFFFVWLMSPGQAAAPGTIVQTPESRAAYLAALGEPNSALRRARLLDYQRTNPDSDRINAIEDQLGIINASELADWEAVTRAVYDVRAKTEQKQEALLAYETRWNGRMLGGRGEELEVLRAAIDEAEAAEPLPDRTLEPSESPIPDNIQSDVLAGAPPQMAVTFPIQDQTVVREPVTPESTAVIVQPKIRRNVSPRYPRSAQNRKVGAIVTLTMNIDDRGRVAMTEIVSVEAERYEKDFIRAAERAAKRTRFHPKTINGEPVPAVGIRKRYIFKVE